MHVHIYMIWEEVSSNKEKKLSLKECTKALKIWRPFYKMIHKKSRTSPAKVTMQ